ncbi:MAG: hypothetical protein EB053_04355 [Chlamydiae bacterium]|nr:hypothetical protein [Chlamydiota bacterium]
MHKELLTIVQDLKFLLTPKKGQIRPLLNDLASNVNHANPIDSKPKGQRSNSSIIHSSEVQKKNLDHQPLPPLRIKPVEGPQLKKGVEKGLAKSQGPILTDLIDWYQKKFKTSIVTPLSDKRASDAKKRFEEGTQEAPIVILLPKKGQKELELYKNIQIVIHNYLLGCQALLYDQFSKELALKTRLILTDPSWIKPYENQIIKDLSPPEDSLWGVPIFYFESYEKLKTSESKERLWKALLSLSRM